MFAPMFAFYQVYVIYLRTQFASYVLLAFLLKS